jgi:uracil-DNA glycosylase
LAFSVNKGVKIPPSLANMYKELETDIEGFQKPDHGYLLNWAKQGVFLLNNVLTVTEDKPDSHKKIGWEKFTNSTIEYINENCENVVFILWGGNARKKAKKLNKEKHLVLESPHPSPLSSYRGFFGCKHFSKANEYLKKNNKSEIDWKNI